MDLIVMLYYAAICAVLSVSVGPTRRWTVRLGIGASVGVIAAAALPALRFTLGV